MKYMSATNFDQGIKLKKPPKHILKLILFDIGKEGTQNTRTLGSVAGALSLIGGFMSTMLLLTKSGYDFLTGPFTELKLAAAFASII